MDAFLHGAVLFLYGAFGAEIIRLEPNSGFLLLHSIETGATLACYLSITSLSQDHGAKNTDREQRFPM